MMKTFIERWQYGICARVVDGALVAKIKTAVEPVALRLSLDKISVATLVVQSAGADYHLLFVQAGGNVPVATFDNRAAADVARWQIACALYCGGHPSRFKRAFHATLGIVVALVLVGLLATGLESLLGNKGASPASSLMPAELSSAMHAPTAPAPIAPAAPAASGEPMSADEFLKQ